MVLVTVPFVAIVAYFVWPLFSILIDGLGTIIGKSGPIGLFIYGFTERLLIPTGLHHVLNQLIRFTPSWWNCYDRWSNSFWCIEYFPS